MTELEPEHDRLLVLVAGAVAHKLKQPLAVAWGYMELLLDNPPADLDPIVLAYLREIDASLRTMDDVVNRLQRATLTRTRAYAGGAEILDLDALPVN